MSIHMWWMMLAVVLVIIYARAGLSCLEATIHGPVNIMPGCSRCSS